MSSICLSVCQLVHLVLTLIAEGFESSLTFSISYWFSASMLPTEAGHVDTSPKDSSYCIFLVLQSNKKPTMHKYDGSI